MECFIERAAQIDSRFASEKEDAKKTLKQRWNEELDLITGRREQSEARADRPLTGWGVTVAISLLFCLPLGTAFLGLYSGHDFWTDPFAWLFMITYAIPALVALAAWMKGGFEVDALKSLLLREARQDTVTTTVKTREPSSVDFKKLFTAIAARLLLRDSRRLILVIDNLDRIDAVSAVSVWTTMRIFFELEDDTRAWRERLWLIVPFDRTALSGLWKAPENGGTPTDFVDSFLEKTFQITFHVPPAVLTQWKAYFRRGLDKGVSTKHCGR